MLVDVDDVESWYVTALDGLRHLSTALHTTKQTQISEATLDEIYGMSPHEWQEFLEDRESEHEMFASLALLASFEGCIRRDVKSRCITARARHYESFKELADDHHVKISRIFELWEKEYPHGHPLRPQFKILRSLYSDRNVIAHGRANRGQFDFYLIFSKLQTAHNRWRELVPDFDRLS